METLTNSHAFVVPKRRSTVVYGPGVPENKISGIHAWFQPLASTVLEPLEFLVGPVEEVPLDPATLRLRICKLAGLRPMMVGVL